MDEKARSSVDLGSEALSFRFIVAEPGKKRFSYKYGPYAGWVHLLFDVGFVTGYAAAKGTPPTWIKVEYFRGETLVETKDLGNGQRTDEDPGQGPNHPTGN